MDVKQEVVAEHVTNDFGFTSSKKCGSRMTVPVMVHHTLTMASNNGNGALI